ncbi:hypothetical protein N7451_001838 [Penicillium sp. IBT 35674x]|nr:hypothetical protein N7451_001838 [Penicillium sp. IBT 35674x]
MGVNLDQIEFYHGPSRPPPSTSAKSVPTDHASAHVPQYFLQSSPTGFGFRPGPCEVPLGQSPPLTGATHAWNIFDFEVNNVYGPTRPEMTKDVESAVTTNMLAAREIPFDRRNSALAYSEPVLSTDSVEIILCPARPDYIHSVPPDV